MTTGAEPDGSRRPSIKNVAQRAGVSFQTASKVLRGEGTVAKETRERIHVVADELGYVTNDVARSLVTRRTRTIGVAVGDLSDHIVAKFVAGAEQEARAQQHSVFIVSVDTSSDGGERSLRTLLERRVDGIVLAAPRLEVDDHLGALLRGPIPVVSIHRVVGGGVRLVGSDQRETARLATAHLLGLGHTRIGMITGDRSRRVAHSRSQGYEAALSASGLTPDPDLVAEGDWQPSGGYAAATTLLDRYRDITALYVQNDLMAVGALHAASDRGLHVPTHLAVIGCDDIPTAAHTVPTLSTVRLPFAETGAMAVRMLLDGAEGASADERERRVLLPVELICRRSCGCESGTPDSLRRPEPANGGGR
jgi:LacI family transcriptional regulator